MKMNKKSIPIAVVAVVVIGGTFFGGMAYGKNTAGFSAKNFQNLTPEQRQAFTQGRGGQQGGNRGAMMGGQNGGLINGEILSKDDKSITLKLRDGGSKIIVLSNSTTVTKSVVGSLTDLAVGTQVSVNGKTGSDGTVSAQSIQIKPAPTVGKATIDAAGVKNFTVSEGNFFFNPSEIRVKKGDKVKITFNDEDGSHDFIIDELNLKTSKINAGESATLEFTADKVGEFAYYCSVGQHRANGMEGKLIVE